MGIMMYCMLTGLLVLMAQCCQANQVVTINLNHPIFKTDDRFLSFTIDQFLLGTTPKWDTFDFNSTRIKTLLRGLSPAYLRFGGSPADWTVYTNLPASKFKGINLGRDFYTLTSNDLDNLVALTRSTGLRFLYEFNLQFRFGLQWDPTNAIYILEHIAKQGYGDNLDFELGNEPGAYSPSHEQIRLGGKQIGKDYISLRKLLDNYNLKGSKLVGPDEVEINSGTDEVMNLTSGILSDFADTCGNCIDALTIHQYYFYGPNAKVDDYINPKYFHVLEKTLSSVKAMIKKSSVPNKPVWIGETSDSWGSGTPNVSDRYVNGFMWLEKLGLSAKMGIGVVMRQDFYGHNYPLIGNDTYPNPDYWLSYIYKKLVGNKVLNVTVQSTVQPDTTRVYAHCTNHGVQHAESGAVTMYALNVNTTDTAVLSLPVELTHQQGQLYLLSSAASDLTSRRVLLNGIPMVMTSDTTLPALKPAVINIAQTIKIPPLTMAFIVFPKASAPACV